MVWVLASCCHDLQQRYLESTRRVRTEFSHGNYTKKTEIKLFSECKMGIWVILMAFCSHQNKLLTFRLRSNEMFVPVAETKKKSDSFVPQKRPVLFLKQVSGRNSTPDLIPNYGWWLGEGSHLILLPSVYKVALHSRLGLLKFVSGLFRDNLVSVTSSSWHAVRLIFSVNDHEP